MSSDELRQSLTQLMEARAETGKILTKINTIHEKCKKNDQARNALRQHPRG